MPLQDPPKQIDPHEQDPHSLDDDGFERVQGIRTPDRSPEGAPGDPQVKQGNLGFMILGSILAVVIISIAIGLLLDPMAGVLAFALLMAIAVVANPVIWAAVLRGKERGPETDHN